MDAALLFFFAVLFRQALAPASHAWDRFSTQSAAPSRDLSVRDGLVPSSAKSKLQCRCCGQKQPESARLLCECPEPRAHPYEIPWNPTRKSSSNTLTSSTSTLPWTTIKCTNTRPVTHRRTRKWRL